METSRVHLAKAVPEAYQAVLKLDRVAAQAATDAGFSAGFSHLLRLRASQVNHCAFCMRMHARDASASGESQDRLAVVSAWRETDYFTAKERAALSLIESVTRIATDQMPDSMYEEVSAVLSEQEIAAVEWLGIVMNAWNRIAIASRYVVRSE